MAKVEYMAAACPALSKRGEHLARLSTYRLWWREQHCGVKIALQRDLPAHAAACF